MSRERQAGHAHNYLALKYSGESSQCLQNHIKLTLRRTESESTSRIPNLTIKTISSERSRHCYDEKRTMQDIKAEQLSTTQKSAQHYTTERRQNSIGTLVNGSVNYSGGVSETRFNSWHSSDLIVSPAGRATSIERLFIVVAPTRNHKTRSDGILHGIILDGMCNNRFIASWDRNEFQLNRFCRNTNPFTKSTISSLSQELFSHNN